MATSIENLESLVQSALKNNQSHFDTELSIIEEEMRAILMLSAEKDRAAKPLEPHENPM